jgi:hypothetical protein
MANTGDRFEMPDGGVYEVTAAAADSAGELVITGGRRIFERRSTSRC